MKNPAKQHPWHRKAAEPVIHPKPYTIAAQDQESLDVWGFKDTGFRINSQGHVELAGTRYELSGKALPDLLPWIQNIMQVTIDTTDVNQPQYPPQIPEPKTHTAFETELKNILPADNISKDPQTRLRHGHGHTQHEMYAIKYESLPRVPDVVLFPTTEEQIQNITELAQKHSVCLIPYGGGTNVTEALLCPQNEERLIVSVSTKNLNQVLWIDPTNRQACIQAGAVGRHIQEELAKHGFTLGHEPDSIEFSTLGGWIATHASGMKKNQYGNIEDIVTDYTLITPQGTIKTNKPSPRESTGMDPRLWAFGSEGTLGIITQAVVKIFPLPKEQRYGSVLFPCFEDGLAFMYDVAQSGYVPASLRLVDNLQFQFGRSLKPKAQGLAALKSKIEKFFVTKLKGFDPKQMVVCTLVFEGTKHHVNTQESQVYKMAKRHNGLKAGAENGRRGYQLTFSIAYIRDFVMNHYVLGESFETSVSWDKADELCTRVKNRLHQEHQKRGLPGKPFVTCRVTQVYATGVCIYFYFAFYFKNIKQPSQVYAEMEHAAREEILACGGSLSHHHGVGKIRQGFLNQVKPEAVLALNKQLKEAIDPQNIFGCGNQLLNTPQSHFEKTGS